MGTAIVPVLTAERESAIDARSLARFCALEPRQELSPQVVRMHVPDAMYRIESDGQPEGRCSLWWSGTPRLSDKQVGLIGHFCAQSAENAIRLLEFACARLREAGCGTAIGPVDGSTWRRYRLVTWRAADPPFFLEPDNPSEWPAYFEAAGFAPLAQYYSSKCDDLETYPPDERLDAQLRRAGLRTRPLDMTRLDDEMSVLWRIATDAFSANFLYTPITQSGFRDLYAAAIRVIRPELAHIAEDGGVPVAFMFAVPDLLQARAGARVDTLILKTLGVVKACHGRGIGNWMVDGAFARARTLGFRSGVFALMHEDNVSRKMGHGRMRDIRRYTLYSRPL